MKERMNELEKEIQELKSQTEAPEHHKATKDTQDEPVPRNTTGTNMDNGRCDSADSDTRSCPSNEEVQNEHQAHIPKFSRLEGRESNLAQGERLRTGTAFIKPASTIKTTIPTTKKVLQPLIDTNSPSQSEHPRPSITSTPSPGFAWLPNSQMQTQTHTPEWFWCHTRAPEDLFEVMTSQCPMEGETSRCRPSN
jgi:hypothetical protein